MFVQKVGIYEKLKFSCVRPKDRIVLKKGFTLYLFCAGYRTLYTLMLYLLYMLKKHIGYTRFV